MKTLSIDIETYSSINLSQSGVYRYVEADDFEILLFSYSIDKGDIKIIDLAKGEQIPKDILDALLDDSVIKWAFNAQFERICLSAYLVQIGRNSTKYLNPTSWRCSMVWAAYLGLPFSLESVGNVLGLKKQKLSQGKDLIRYFSMPCKPTQSNKKRNRNLPRHAPDKWELFKKYNKRDVEVEMAIQDRFSSFPLPAFEWVNYRRDQEINDLGILIDQEFASEAIRIDDIARREMLSQMCEITKLENPNSVQQLSEWLKNQGVEIKSLERKVVKRLIPKVKEPIRTVLSLRLSLAKSSIKKYTSMESCVCADGRVRGLLQFYGASRTGRWAGRLIQVQNLPRNNISDLTLARDLVRSGGFDTLDLLFDSVPSVLSQLIRTAFIPKRNHVFIVSDFSAIEARVLAWFADERWRIDLFDQGGDIYCQSASKMFGVPVEKNGVNSHLRQKGKIAELACGYGGSVGALKAMGALAMGLKEHELYPLVNSWRESNSNIVRLWWEIDKAAKNAVKARTSTRTHGITFEYRSAMLFIHLPSGRHLSYVKPRIGENQYGGECVTYEGIGTGRRWERMDTYGPKLVENIVQAIARDILCSAIRELQHLDIVMHVHDELVIEAPPEVSVKDLSKEMSKTPVWAKDLKLDADAFVCEFYQKD